MGSQQKQVQAARKEQYARKLERRIAFLTEKGFESAKIDRDTTVKKLKADIRAVDSRLAVIDAKVKKAEEQVRVKAEKKAAAEAPAPPKEKKEKEAKKAPKEKAEKAPAEGAAKKEKVKKEKPKKEESEPAS